MLKVKGTCERNRLKGREDNMKVRGKYREENTDSRNFWMTTEVRGRMIMLHTRRVNKSTCSLRNKHGRAEKEANE